MAPAGIQQSGLEAASGKRRLIVVDPGRRQIRLLALRRGWFGVRAEAVHALDAEAEGVLSMEETASHLDAIFPAWRGAELAILVPQDRVITMLLDVPEEGEPAAREHILQEALRLSGLPRASLAVAYRRLRPFGRRANPYRVVLYKREELTGLLARFGVADPEKSDWILAEATPGSEALFASACALGRRGRNAVFVEWRRHYTTVAVVWNGQGVFATSLPLGLSRVARAWVGEDASAEEALARIGALGPEASLPEPASQAFEEWRKGLERVILEWAEDNSELGVAAETLPLFLCGPGAAVPALRARLKREWKGRTRLLGEGRRAADGRELSAHWTAYALGAAAWRGGAGTISLLPEPWAALRQGRRRARRAALAAAAATVAAGCALAAAASQKWSHARRLEAKAARLREALAAAEQIGRKQTEIRSLCEALRPVRRGLLDSRGAVAFLSAWADAGLGEEEWLALAADAWSYRRGSAAPGQGTNRAEQAFGAEPAPGYVGELCLPLQGEALRRRLRKIAEELQRRLPFASVDLLPPGERRDWMGTNLVIPNRVFALRAALPEAASQPVSGGRAFRSAAVSGDRAQAASKPPPLIRIKNIKPAAKAAPAAAKTKP